MGHRGLSILLHCLAPGPSTHPCVELDGGAILNQGANAVSWVHCPTQVAVQCPVTCPPLVLVLQGRQLDGLDVHAGVYQLTDPAPNTRGLVIREGEAIVPRRKEAEEGKRGRLSEALK